MTRGRIVAALTGALGLLGLGLTLLPLITVRVSGRFLDLLTDADDFWRFWVDAGALQEDWDRMCSEYSYGCAGEGAGTVDINAYDLLASGYTVGAVVPLALALAAAVGALSAWRVRDGRVFVFLALCSAGGLAVLLFTLVNPAIVLDGTGDFATADAGERSSGGEDFTFSVGAGLYLPAIVLAVIFVLTAWLAVAENLVDRRRGSATPQFAGF